jgi:glycosyltransferase involved in cell wall biosynthesis
MREVISGFRKRGHEVTPLIMGGLTMNDAQDIEFNHSPLKQLARKIIPIQIWNWMKDRKLKKFDIECENILSEAITAKKPDLIYERGYYMMTSGLEQAARHKVPIIIELNAPYPQEKIDLEGNRFSQRAGDNAEYRQVSEAKRIVVVSSDLKKYLCDKHSAQPEKILVTPNAVNLEDFEPRPESVETLQGELGFKPGEQIIGFVGSIFPYHGVDKLIQAFESLSKSRDQLKLLVVGDGEILPQLKQSVLDSGLSEKVVFTGNVKHREVPLYIAVMDITVMPTSNWYGSPVKIFEYGAMGKVVIAPDNGPVNDVMKNGDTGILITNGQNNLVDALKNAIDHRDKSLEMAKKFQNQVRQNHTWDEVAKSILDGFEQIPEAN